MPMLHVECHRIARRVRRDQK